VPKLLLHCQRGLSHLRIDVRRDLIRQYIDDLEAMMMSYDEV